MKWRPELNGQGFYWWQAKTPLGPIYAEWEHDKHPLGWHAYWQPYDADKETSAGRYATEELAKAAAEKWIRDYARKLGLKLVKFGEAK